MIGIITPISCQNKDYIDYNDKDYIDYNDMVLLINK